MKKRLIALLLVLVLVIPAGIASAVTYYRVSSTLQVRLQPSESAKVLASYKKDSVCTVSSTKDGWSYVTFYNGTQGYVKTSYLKKASSYSAWVAYDDTQLRPKPDGGSGSNASLAKGTKVTVLSHGANYDYVQTSDFGRGYIVNSRLSKKKVKASGSESTSNMGGGGNYDAWVLIAGYRTVNLRASASKNAAVIARYPTATKVHVISHGATWDYISVDGNTGWMMNAYLSTSEPAPTAEPAAVGPQNNNGSGYTAYVATSNKKGVNFRRGPGKGYGSVNGQSKIPYGAAVIVLKHDKKWDKVRYGGKEGYVDNSFLQLTKPADAGNVITPDPNATPAPAPVFQEYDAKVTVNDLNFHKQKGDWSSNVDGVGRLQQGQTVRVLAIEGDWAKVRYNGYTGWVHKKFLSN